MDTSVSTTQAVATVISVEGQAFARSPAGHMRPLKPGDVVREGETIITLLGGQVLRKGGGGKANGEYGNGDG